jgi:exodeoxyribonuclease VII small subunit
MPGSKRHAPDAAAPAGAELPFEEALERLETIVEELEAGSLTLEESLARYEEGIRLSRRLTASLDEAEKRIERLVEEPGQPPTTRVLSNAPRAGTPEGGSEGPEGELPF